MRADGLCSMQPGTVGQFNIKKENIGLRSRVVIDRYFTGIGCDTDGAVVCGAPILHRLCQLLHRSRLILKNTDIQFHSVPPVRDERQKMYAFGILYTFIINDSNQIARARTAAGVAGQQIGRWNGGFVQTNRKTDENPLVFLMKNRQKGENRIWALGDIAFYSGWNKI